jgi:hypothetical protein
MFIATGGYAVIDFGHDSTRNGDDDEDGDFQIRLYMYSPYSMGECWERGTDESACSTAQFPASRTQRPGNAHSSDNVHDSLDDLSLDDQINLAVMSGRP